MNGENQEETSSSVHNAVDLIDALKHGQDRNIKDAVIEGTFDLRSLDIEGRINIENTRFKGPVDWSHATFRQVVNLKGSIFEADFVCDSVTLAKGILLDNVTFKKPVDFSNMTVKGVFHSPSATFKENARFAGSTFDKSVVFSDSHFEGELDFHGATEVGGDVDFIRAHFHDRADFYSIQIRGSAFFFLATFDGPVFFTAAQIGEDAEFTGAEFRDTASFGGISIKGDAAFLLAVFEERVSFGSAQIGGAAEFCGTRFVQEASFNTVQVGGGAFFRAMSESEITQYMVNQAGRVPGLEEALKEKTSNGNKNTSRSPLFRPTTFNGTVDFIAANIGGAAEFNEVVFEGKTKFYSFSVKLHARFDGALFKGAAGFEWSQMSSSAEFAGVSFCQDLYMDNARITGAAFFTPRFLDSVEEGQTDLDRRQIPESIRRAFETRQIPLSEEAVVTIDTKGHRWFITDNHGESVSFLVTRTNDQLNVFRITTFLGKTVFQGAHIGGTADFAYTRFEQEANFSNAHVESDAWFNPATFKGKTDFIGAQIGGTASFINARFEQDASFNGARVNGNAFFKPATFKGNADFRTAYIGGAGEFDGATFHKTFNMGNAHITGDTVFRRRFLFSVEEGQAELDLLQIPETIRQEFENRQMPLSQAAAVTLIDAESHRWLIADSHAEGALFLVTRANDHLNVFRCTTFVGNAYFPGVQIDGTANFSDAIFGQETSFANTRMERDARFDLAIFKGKAVFEATQIGGTANFNNAIFEREVRFNSARIEGNTFFTPATFKGNAVFEAAQIEGTANFTNATFEQEASFNSARIAGNALFRPTTFKGSADFIAAQIDGAAEFTNAVFEQEAKFDLARIGMQIALWSTVFEKELSLASATAGTIALNEFTTFSGIDLRGCTYGSIKPIDQWEKLITNLDPYDRQPFTQLEQTVRSAGREGLANDIYYKGRVERSRKLQRFGSELIDFSLRWLVGYGVRRGRLLVAVCLILLFGMFVFEIDGAVVTETATSKLAAKMVPLNWGQAFLFSVKHFLPVGIPFGDGLVPSTEGIWITGIPFDVFATFMTVIGWVLVPVAVAALTGALKR